MKIGFAIMFVILSVGSLVQHVAGNTDKATYLLVHAAVMLMLFQQS